jgi:DnaJ-domain-containing protein 1
MDIGVGAYVIFLGLLFHVAIVERWQRTAQQKQRREQRAWEQEQQQRNQREARAQQARERAQREQREQQEQREREQREQRERTQKERAQREQRGGPHQGTRPWWEVLGVSQGSCMDEVKAAYRTKIKQCHPDRVMGLGEEFQQLADRKTREVNEAFNEARRRANTWALHGVNASLKLPENQRFEIVGFLALLGRILWFECAGRPARSRWWESTTVKE